MDKVLTRTRQSTRLNKRENQLDVDYHKNQNIDQTFSETYSGIDDSHNNYFSNNKTMKYNAQNNRSNTNNKRTSNKANRRGGQQNNNQNASYSEDEQFRQMVEIFSNFVVDLNKTVKRQGGKKNKKGNKNINVNTIENAVNNNQKDKNNNQDFYPEDQKNRKKLITERTKDNFLEDNTDTQNMEYYKFSEYRMSKEQPDQRGNPNPHISANSNNEEYLKMQQKMNQKNNQNFNPVMGNPQENMMNMQNYQENPMKGILDILVLNCKNK